METKLFKLMQRLSRRYAGQYVLVLAGRVLASGRSQKEVFKKVRETLSGKQDFSVLYVPEKNAPALLLMVK